MKRFLSVLLILILCFSFAACSKQEPVPDNPVPAEEAFPVTVTDMTGREITIEAKPEKIVSGYYISSSTLIALGAKDRVVAIEANAGKRPIYKLAAPELIDVPNVGTAKAFDLETCIAQEPDLVILPLKQKETAQTLADMGIPTIIVVPESHDQILEMFDLIGKATGNTAEAEKLTAAYNDYLDKVKTLTASLKDEEKPAVFLTSTSDYLTVPAKGMYQTGLISSAGGAPVGDTIDGNSTVKISYEQLLALDPEIIIVPTNSNANGAPDFSVDDILNDPELAEVTAVKNGAVYQMPFGFESWDSPAPSGILGTLWCLQIIHPELYSEDEFQKDATSFYETFYGFTPEFR